jgi:hypothetical protein
MASAEAGEPTWQPSGSCFLSSSGHTGDIQQLNALASRRVIILARGRPGTPSSHDHQSTTSARLAKALEDQGALIRGNFSSAAPA